MSDTQRKHGELVGHLSELRLELVFELADPAS